MLKELSIIYQNLLENKYENIYIWGSNSESYNLYEHYLDDEVTVKGLIDFNCEKKVYCNLPIISIDQLLNDTPNTTFILLCSENLDEYYDIRFFLTEHGYVEGVNFYDFAHHYMPARWKKKEAILKIKSLYQNRHEQINSLYEAMYKNYAALLLKKKHLSANADFLDFDVIHSKYANNFLLSMSVLITSKCNLNCDECSHCMHLISESSHFLDIDNILDDIRKVAEVSYICELPILGGEPFLYPKLIELLQQVLLIDNVGIITLVTNGALTISDNILDFLTDNPRIVIRISNYFEKNGRVNTFKNSLEQRNIPHFILPYEGEWMKLGDYHFRGYTEEILKQLRKLCIGFHSPSLLNGKLYGCPHMAFLDYLNLIQTDSRNYVDIRNTDKESLLQKLNFFHREQESFMACNYCCGAHEGSELTDKAVQLKKKRKYM